MLTRIEIDGFKTFEDFSLDIQPFTAIVGPNASGKSNLFDALKFLSRLAQTDIRTAMQECRGLPDELFRIVPGHNSDIITFAVEALLERTGIDPFGSEYSIPSQRLRYEVKLGISRNADGSPRSVNVTHELCTPISKKNDRSSYAKSRKPNYNGNVSPFIRVSEANDAIEIRQDGRQKHGRPIRLSLNEASRTALSTVTTAEFPHLYALKQKLTDITFLEINPKAARSDNDRFEDRSLKSDASNLAAVLAHLKDETSTKERQNGVLSDISSDLSALIPSVMDLTVEGDSGQRTYSFRLSFVDSLNFSSRVISDGTLRLLALLTVLNDPRRRGTLCFEEPENGVHEGRIPLLVNFLRDATETQEGYEPFQIIINTHSPKVMSSLNDSEIVAADTVSSFDSKNKTRTTKTRMRTSVVSSTIHIDLEHTLSRIELARLLQRQADSA